MGTETTPTTPKRNNNSGTGLPDRHKETDEGFDVMLNPLRTSVRLAMVVTPLLIPFGMSLRQLLFWGICRLPHTVRAVWCALRRMCKWCELYWSRGVGVKSDAGIRPENPRT